MQIVISIPSDRRRAWWVDHLQGLMPEATVVDAEGHYDRDATHYAVVWRPRDGWLASHRKLRAVVSIGAGIDHVLADTDYPEGLPIIRTTGEELTLRMCEYVALQVLRLHRRQPEMERAAAEGRWTPKITPTAARRGVGIMGLGTLGGAAARTLRDLGFAVHGWSRSGGPIDGVRVHAGDAGLDDFLAASEILVCLLPLTESTRDILDHELFSRLPEGAMLVNAARGEHLVDDDLLDALESGRLAEATLDVFRREPLPAEHPFWTHPRVTITPHVASMIDPESGGRIIAENIRRFDAGEDIDDRVDLERGY